MYEKFVHRFLFETPPPYLPNLTMMICAAHRANIHCVRMYMLNVRSDHHQPGECQTLQSFRHLTRLLLIPITFRCPARKRKQNVCVCALMDIILIRALITLTYIYTHIHANP